MANRFKRSIDAVGAENVEPIGGQLIIEPKNYAEAVYNENVKGKDNIESNIVSNIIPNILYNTSNNILDNIHGKSQTEEQRGKAVTLYLSREVAEALESVSVQKGISKSKLADGIFKQVLIKGQ